MIIHLPTPTPASAALPTSDITPDAFPLIYGLALNCLEPVNGWAPGTPLAFTQLDQPSAGDVAAVYVKGRSPALLKLLTGFLSEDWLSLPDLRMATGSTVLPMVVGTVLGTDRIFSVPLDRVAAIHKCLGPIDLLKAEAAQ